MKAQTQAISLVLISGIVIALVGTTYFWGKPLIEKRTTMTQYTSALRDMEDLDKIIVDMANNCRTPDGCSETKAFTTPGLITVDPNKNEITYEFYVPQPLITDTKVPMNTGNTGDIVDFGETAGVIEFEGVSTEAGYKLKFALRYRQKYNKQQCKGYKINLTDPSSGTNKITVIYKGEDIVPGKAKDGCDLVFDYIKAQAL
jgi:hypothetical protein